MEEVQLETCKSLHCRTRVVNVAGIVFQRGRIDGKIVLEPHVCYEAPKAVAPDTLYLAKWVKKDDPTRFRYSRAEKTFNRSMLRAPDVGTTDYTNYKNTKSEFELVGYFKCVPKWVEYTPDLEDYRLTSHPRDGQLLDNVED